MRYLDKEYTLDLTPYNHPITGEPWKFEAELYYSDWIGYPLCLVSAKTPLHCVYQMVDTIMDKGLPHNCEEDNTSVLEWLRGIQTKLEETNTDGRCYKRGPFYPL